MTAPSAAFVLGAGATLVELCAVIALVLRPLSATLEELCGTRERGHSWVALCCAGLAAATLLASLLGYRLSIGADALTSAASAASAEHASALFWASLRMAQWATVALLASLATIGGVVLVSTAHPCQTPAPGKELP